MVAFPRVRSRMLTLAYVTLFRCVVLRSVYIQVYSSMHYVTCIILVESIIIAVLISHGWCSSFGASGLRLGAEKWSTKIFYIGERERRSRRMLGHHFPLTRERVKDVGWPT
ncbi:hypothetical protein BDV23DRAFT_165878 [Aspergillus alliaceus]|uniref:Uncharacterized protein n=1 Tax=Petromyces alliaceus TaxID=209559 RepID=A0A5N7BT84_PETAA|nr:uncharacterized protein BDW43DRAFT_269949 [Aspergillus alliaceus]KAB8235373.1 hypothetical protein BDW43DRAFT_269949 [Aspergillus alliaceus]KAE8384959.1 hypothetical protein BDV23DRAFT_165878 [Aspergillus alliaceus]